VGNPRYHGTANADELIFAIHPPDADGTPTRLIEAAKQGQIDVTLHLAAHDVIRHGISGFQPMMQPGNSTGFLFLNCERPLFRDASLRRAVNPSPANRKLITDLIESQAMMVPLIYGASTAIHARKVKDFHITPSGHVSLADIVF